MGIKDYLGETTLYEKKEKVEKNKVKNWLKTVSAFANGKGGVLIFGINDNDEIIGLESYKKDSEFVSEKIKTQIDPIPNIEIEFINICFWFKFIQEIKLLITMLEMDQDRHL